MTLPSATAFVLFYGDHPDLAGGFFAHWSRHRNGLALRVGLNACGPATEEIVAGAVRDVPDICVVRSDENLGKPGMMGRLFREFPPSTEWVIWFDDDSHPCRADWALSLGVAMAAQPEAVMLGVEAVVDIDAPMARFVREAPWYRGLSLAAAGSPGAAAAIRFLLGGFWVLKSDWIRRLDWPDPRMVHFEDDYLLGEAIRQQGGRLGSFRSGVRIDTAPRRAPAEMHRRFLDRFGEGTGGG